MAKIKYQEFRNLRKRNLYTVRALADELGVSFNLIYCWETGQSKPQIELLPKLAKLLDTDVNRLVKIFYDVDLNG